MWNICWIVGLTFPVLQDRKPLKEEVNIPQSLHEQAEVQMKSLLGTAGEATTEEHMVEMVKASI